jgi:hypothetical protein
MFLGEEREEREEGKIFLCQKEYRVNRGRSYYRVGLLRYGSTGLSHYHNLINIETSA